MRRVAVAVSGGRDSTALLHCTAKAAANQHVEVVALHVHHGLNAQADVWLAHVQQQSKRWGLGFACSRLNGHPSAGESVEAWARRERYAALAMMARANNCSLVLLAHHRRDQAETWLLQALRGAGAAGLSAMPWQYAEAGLQWCRPWLERPRESIDAYVRRHRLKHIEDGSNADPRFARNRLRLHLWPALMQAFPDAEQALQASATRAQEAAALAEEVARVDLPAVSAGPALQIANWFALPPARQLNALRAWLQQSLGRGAPQSLMDRLMGELPARKTAQWQAPGASLRLYRGLLVATPARACALPCAVELAPAALVLDLSRAGIVQVPGWRGQFVVKPVSQGGIATAVLQTAQARAREGGEAFQFTARSSARSLKKQFQARGIAAWQREGPLLFSAQGQLLFVPGLGANGNALAAPGQAQLQLFWQPDDLLQPSLPKPTRVLSVRHQADR
jgi:tRNA(Ile)-lysidine synthase